MPIYEYGCENCRTWKERIEFLPTSQRPPLCTKCRKRMTRQVTSPAAFVFKGAGFYDTEYDPTGRHWANKWAGPNPSKEPMPSGFNKKRWSANGPEVKRQKAMNRERAQERKLSTA